MTSRRGWTVAAIVIALVAAGLVGWHVSRPGESAAQRAARVAAAAFLREWVATDGRIVRKDQGGDSVSEGQAYGMLLATAADDEHAFTSIWAWTQTHLQQPDHLLAWRWADGAVADPQPAADADIDAARALMLAGHTFHDPTWTAQGLDIADAVLAHESVAAGAGRVVVAGPWAVKTDSVLNPSYLTSGTARELATTTGNEEWSQVAAGTYAEDRTLIDGGQLPPDWASVDAAGAVQAARSPDGTTAPQYGLDAPRLIIRLATSCDSDDRELAAQIRPMLGGVGEPAIRSLTGAGQVGWQHPITEIALAAADKAAGQPAQMTAALAAAQRLQTASPSYYGAAWVALGQTLLTTNLLSKC